jgi:hypothetical protein
MAATWEEGVIGIEECIWQNIELAPTGIGVRVLIPHLSSNIGPLDHFTRKRRCGSPPFPSIIPARSMPPQPIDKHRPSPPSTITTIAVITSHDLFHKHRRHQKDYDGLPESSLYASNRPAQAPRRPTSKEDNKERKRASISNSVDAMTSPRRRASLGPGRVRQRATWRVQGAAAALLELA